MAVTDRQARWLWYLGAAGLLALLPLYYFLDPESGHFPACPFHQFTGLYCTGCGSQRALHDLLHADLGGSLGKNVLFLPAIVLMGWHGAARWGAMQAGKAWRSPLDHRRAPGMILIIVLAYTVLRNLPWPPFTLLAP